MTQFAQEMSVFLDSVSSNKFLAGYARWLLPIGAAGACLALYVVTLQPGLLGGDSAEAQVVPYVLGIFHYTGYPLYALLGNLWIHLVSIDSVAYRMNLLSAVTSALGIGGTVWIGRQLSGKWLGGLIAGALLACSSLYWEWATRAGVRSLNGTFVIAIFAAALWWSDAVNRRAASGLQWFLIWFTVGLSQAHHLTTLLIAPILVLYVVSTRPALVRDGRAWLVAGLAVVPGLLLYLYLPIRSAAQPPYVFQQVDSLEHFLDLALARGQAELVGAVPLPDLIDRVGQLGEFLVSQFTLPGLVLAAAGVGWLLARRWREAVFLLLVALTLTGFTLTYDNEKLSVFYLIPVNFVLALGIGVALVQLARLVEGQGNSIALRLAGNVIALGVAGYLLLQTIPVGLALHPSSEPLLDAYRFELRQEMAARLTHPPNTNPKRAMVIGEWEHIAAFWYSQLVDGAWQGAEFHYPIDASLPEWVGQAWKEGRPVYVTRAIPDLGREYFLTMAGPLIRILREPEGTLPDKAVRFKRVFRAGIALEGFAPLSSTAQPGKPLPILLYWRARRLIDDDYSISVRLVNRAGETVAQADNTHPVLGAAPTSEWTRGAVVGDYYELLPGTALPPGAYSLAVLVYKQEADGTFRNLKTQDTGEELVRFFPLELVPIP